MLRRNFSKGLIGFFATAALPPLLAAAPDLSAREKRVTEFLAERGITRFIMLNEKTGRLLCIDAGKLAFSVPAISGARRGDDIVTSPGSTAAGIWAVRFSPDQKAQDAAIMFQMVSNVPIPYAYVLHRATGNGPEQRRIDRLNGVKPFNDPDRDLRISDGCVNLRSADYDRVSRFLESASNGIYNDAGTHPVRGSIFVSLPEDDAPVAMEAFLNRYRETPERMLYKEKPVYSFDIIN